MSLRLPPPNLVQSSHRSGSGVERHGVERKRGNGRYMIDSNSWSKIASIRILPPASRIANEYNILEGSKVSVLFARHITNAI